MLNDQNTSDRLPRSSRCVVMREIAGETLLLPIGNDLNLLDSLFVLNETGRAVWRRLDGTTSIAGLASEIADANGVAPAQVEADIRVFIDQIAAAGLIDRTEP